MTKTNTKKINSNTQHRLPLYRRTWFLLLVVIALIASIVCLIIFLVKPDKASTLEHTEPDTTTQESSDPETTKVNNGQHINEDTPYSDPDQITIQYEGENPNLANDLSGSITYTDYTNGILSIGTMIDQYLTDGSCDLTLTDNNGNIYTVNSNIFAPGASTSACNDLSVGVAPGNYQIKITLSSNGKQGIITGEANL